MFKRKQPHHGISGAIRYTWSQVWRTMVAGLLVWVPLLITVWLMSFLINRFVFGAERQLKNMIDYLQAWAEKLEGRYPPLALLEFIDYKYGMGIVLVICLFLGTGILTRHLIGRKIIALGERVVHFIPIVNRIYRAVQQIRDTFMNRQGAVFQAVCLVAYPRPGMLAVAFVTCNDQELIKELTGQRLIAVFVPTTPNPTSGYLIYVPPQDITYLDISIEDAMKLIVSAGAYVPPSARVNTFEGAKEPENAT
jgi:uncharacterized membrane protein